MAIMDIEWSTINDDENKKKMPTNTINMVDSWAIYNIIVTINLWDIVSKKFVIIIIIIASIDECCCKLFITDEKESSQK